VDEEEEEEEEGRAGETERVRARGESRRSAARRKDRGERARRDDWGLSLLNGLNFAKFETVRDRWRVHPYPPPSAWPYI